jgi:outer membrane protein
MFRKLGAMAALAFGLAVSPAMTTVATAGDPAGNFQIKLGYTGVFWDNENKGIKVDGVTLVGQGAEVRDLSLPTATLTYYLTRNIGLELFCCFAHAKVIGTGSLLRGQQLAETWTFPPALTLKYNFDGLGPVVPYIGVGAQWIHYFRERSKLPAIGLGFDKVSLDDSFGVVLQAGFDYNLGSGWSFGLDVKKVWEDTKLTFTNTAGNRITSSHDLDPLLVTANFGYRFNLFGGTSAAPLK